MTVCCDIARKTSGEPRRNNMSVKNQDLPSSQNITKEIIWLSLQHTIIATVAKLFWLRNISMLDKDADPVSLCILYKWEQYPLLIYNWFRKTSVQCAGVPQKGIYRYFQQESLTPNHITLCTESLLILMMGVWLFAGEGDSLGKGSSSPSFLARSAPNSSDGCGYYCSTK